MDDTATVRRATASDAPLLARVQAEPRVERFVTSETEAEAIVTMADTDQLYLLGLDNEQEVAFALLCGLEGPDHSIEVRKLGAIVTGGGHGAELLRNVIDLSFTEFGANRIWLDAFTENSGARALYTSLGFVEEGVLREAYFWQGRYQSVAIMSILRSEYVS